MSQCGGDIPLSTKTDKTMQEFVDSEARRLGVNRSEFFRRLLEDYRESRRENLHCPHCGEPVVFDLRE